MKHVGIEIKFYNLDTFKKQIDVNFIDLDSNLVDLNYKVTSLIFCHFVNSLTHSLTHSILINLSIKVRLNRLLLPPLLSITFVPSGFYVYFWNILEGTSKANFFFPTHQL